MIVSTVTNKKAGNAEVPTIGSSVTNEKVEDTIHHVVDILKSFAPKTDEEIKDNIQTRISARTTK